MNKTILTSFFIITNFLGFNAFAETGTTYDNIREESVQSILSKDGQIPNVPKTDLTKSVGINIKSNTVANPDGSKWGEKVSQPFFRYSNNGIANCKGTGSSCASAASKNIDLKTKEGFESSTLTIPESSGVDNAGFITATSASVESDGDGYFYRYWNTNCNLKEVDKSGAIITSKNLDGCWSPSYPRVCFEGYNSSNFENLIGSDNYSIAKDYFGKRGDLEDGKNSYYDELNSYQINAELTPDTNASSSTKFIGNYVNGITSINVVRWTKKDTPNGTPICLDPDFNFGNLVSSDSHTQYIRDPSAAGLKKEITFAGNSEIILPCGMFTRKDSNGKDINNDIMKNNYNATIDISGKMSCNNYAVYRTKDSTGDKLYTRYRVKLPTNNVNNYVDGINGKKYLNVRACAVCKSLANECENLIYAVLESHGCKNGQCPNDTSLESVIKDLRTAKRFNFNNDKNISEELSDIRYDKPLQCDHNGNDNCLVQVENILKEYFKIAG